jgi:tRNA pseudouridine synthase 10
LVNAHHRQSIKLELRRHYNLCNYCTSRHLTIDKYRWSAAKADDGKCDICCGLMKRLDFIIKIMKEKVADVYEFDTFLIGATLPATIYEREDQIRARLKIRGKENIKNQFSSELRHKFELITKKKVDYLLPDVLISVTVGEERRVDIIPKARSLTLFGRYIKKQRGLPQKQSKCTQCKGRGCRICDNCGLPWYGSIEGIIGYRLLSLTKSNAARFSWVGSEDRNSLVSGKGRPFFVTLSNPKVRMLKDSVNINTPEISATVKAKPICVPQSPIRFVTKTKIIVESANTINENKLKDLILLNNATIKFRNKEKTIMKKIYSVKARLIKHNRFLLTLLADGGLAIKNFVSGQQYASPNVSAIVGDKCESVLFDVSDVHLW